jgi:hypothetical protein
LDEASKSKAAPQQHQAGNSAHIYPRHHPDQPLILSIY